MITEKEIVEILDIVIKPFLNQKNVIVDEQVRNNLFRILAISVINKIKKNSVSLKGNAFKFIAQNKKFEQIDYIQTTISPIEREITIYINEERINEGI